MADTTSRSSDSAVSKKRATPTGSLPASSSTNGSNNKRQRLDSKKDTQETNSTADFISLDFSEGEGEDAEEPETISQISKSASAAEENEDAEEVKEKTLKKKKRHRSKKKRKDKELDAQGVRVEEKPEQLNLTGRGDSSDEESSIKVPSKNGHSDTKDAEDESEEEEDKDSSTRRALRAKMTNGTQITEGEIEQNPGPLETAVVAVETPGGDSVGLSNSSNLPIEDSKFITEDEAEISARKSKEKRDKRRKEKKAAKKERKGRTQLDLPKGGDFSNLEEPEVIGISSDDEGLEINVDMDIEDLEEQQGDQPDRGQTRLQAKNESGDEEGEVDENNGEANEKPSEDNVDGNNDNDNDSDNDDDNDRDDSPFLDQAMAIKQRKYYTAYVLPPFEHEEARPYFLIVKNPDFKIDLEREKVTATPHKIKESKRICDVCTKTGHTEDKCELLKV